MCDQSAPSGERQLASSQEGSDSVLSDLKWRWKERCVSSQRPDWPIVVKTSCHSTFCYAIIIATHEARVLGSIQKPTGNFKTQSYISSFYLVLFNTLGRSGFETAGSFKRVASRLSFSFLSEEKVQNADLPTPKFDYVNSDGQIHDHRCRKPQISFAISPIVIRKLTITPSVPPHPLPPPPPQQ